jgi:hypothetical protein
LEDFRDFVVGVSFEEVFFDFLGFLFLKEIIGVDGCVSTPKMQTV